jgi:pimeloyl-ACP methyl ester carboxylesterase
MTMPKQTRDIAKALRAQIVTLPAGHSLMTEVPDGVLNGLRDALARPVEHS